jgi:hypothetical protein
VNLSELLDNLPPSYEVVMGYDFPPPPYATVVAMEDEDKKFGEANGIQHI